MKDRIVQNGVDITLRYVTFTPTARQSFAGRSPLYPRAVDDDFKKTLELTLRIFPFPGETPFDAWGRTMSEENHLPYSAPLHPHLVETIRKLPNCAHFLYVITDPWIYNEGAWASLMGPLPK